MYQMGSGEALIKIVNNKGGEIPTDKVRRILKPEDFKDEKGKTEVSEQYERLKGSRRLLILCILVTIILFVLFIWSIVECLTEGLSCLTFA